MSREIRFYRGKFRVKVVTQSVGYWTVQALEDFEDTEDGERVMVKAGEERIAPPTILFKHQTLEPPIKEHTYELKLEQKVKRMVAKEQQENPQ